MKINEVIVVEGKNDTKRLKLFFDCDTIETHGLGLSKETIDYIAEVNKSRGVILFLDPDSPGEKIRKTINEAIPNLKNAFVMKVDARTTKKVGIEHASKEVLEDALKHMFTYAVEDTSLSYSDYIALGLSGMDESALMREKLAKAFHLGKCNAKTMYKRLNMLGKTKEEIIEVLEEVN